MTAAEAQSYTYGGGGPEDIPKDATHVSIHKSTTVIPARLFYDHPNIIVLICHAGVKRIEKDAFSCCEFLKRAIIPGVEVLEDGVFEECVQLEDIQCDKLEIIGENVFRHCYSIESLTFPSVKIVKAGAFTYCQWLKDLTFGKNLESIRGKAFFDCKRLERITIPLKNGLITHEDTFQGCKNLKHVDLVEGEVQETIAALHLKEWRNDMNREIEFINKALPETYAGEGEERDYEGDLAVLIRDWIAYVLRRIIGYKALHRRLLDETASTLQFVLPNDILMNNVLPFLELPLYVFEGEDEEEDNDEETERNSDDDTFYAAGSSFDSCYESDEEYYTSSFEGVHYFEEDDDDDEEEEEKEEELFDWEQRLDFIISSFELDHRDRER